MPEKLSPRAILEKLVSIPTVSRDSNLPLIEWVETYLNSHGITAHRHYDETNEKAALFAHVGPVTEGAVVLSGHTDVVPVDGQPWGTNPFEVVEKDGKLYGRGTCDMKGFDALAIWTLIEGHYADLKRPLQLALSYDEEIGCLGAPPMIEAMQPIVTKASAVIVGEPSMMQAVSGHKGGFGYHVHMQGFEVHSSILHTGVNAILYGAKIIEWVNQMNSESMAKEPGEVAAKFDPPFTTVHVGTIKGGTAHNITAKDCWFGVDFRVVPGDDAEDWRDLFLAKVDEVEAEMQAVVPETKIVLEERFQLPGLVPEENGEAEAIVRRLTGDNGSHVVSYGTEGGQFQEAGYSAVICGPGDIAQAHQPNEYLTVAQFDAGKAFMERLLVMLKG
ncbi:acetylornithine deacetylase [Shimia thalassica]|uniref:acetylornithine deacetylase n=1 Tax=Shimia thalassica TaxID=1715693 RepID=UPI001C09509A|nr:acetylornithine deacetylase [Shimia thalassica]MBU2944444.1 acetylornithine deacetylase [Shimia thalassica]MDO6502210.1 acetylornithine deacetylase [Shimia thalassica]